MGTPDELDTAFEGTCEQVRQGLPLMRRDKWSRMFDRDPIINCVHRPFPQGRAGDVADQPARLGRGQAQEPREFVAAE